MRKDPASSGSSNGPGTLAARSFADAGIESAVEALNRGFADYVVPMRWTTDALQRRMEAESVDAAASFIYRARNGPAAGVCMMARRGHASRVAAFCVSPEARKAGLGRRMLADALVRSRERGDVRTTLEVIEQNARAVAFYRAQGFTDLRRLYGYRRAPQAGTAASLRDIPIAELADIAARYEDDSAQWQLAAATLRALRSPARAYALQDSAYALVSGVRDDGFDLRALIVPPQQRRAGWGRRMIDALAARHPGKACNVAPIVPEGLVDAFFEATGFVRQSINQVELGGTRPPRSLRSLPPRGLSIAWGGRRNDALDPASRGALRADRQRQIHEVESVLAHDERALTRTDAPAQRARHRQVVHGHHAFVAQQRGLDGDAARVAAEPAGCRNDTVTGNEDRHGIGRQAHADGALRPRHAHPLGQRRVRRDLALRDRAHHVPYAPLHGRGRGGNGDRQECPRLAGEIGGKARRHLVRIARFEAEERPERAAQARLERFDAIVEHHGAHAPLEARDVHDAERRIEPLHVNGGRAARVVRGQHGRHGMSRAEARA